MNREEFLRATQGGIIVSCQALPNEPLYGSDLMARMALAVSMGGAVGIRCGFGQDIRAIREQVDLPVIGLVKRTYPDSPVFITPTLAEVAEVVDAGADAVAVDLTDRPRPGNADALDFIAQVKERYGDDILVMADISTYDEGVRAALAGVDFVSTTMSGYTPYSPQLGGPDFELMERLSRDLTVPVFGEGHIWTPEEAARALLTGVHALIVGTAITRPKDITERFIAQTMSLLNDSEKVRE